MNLFYGKCKLKNGLFNKNETIPDIIRIIKQECTENWSNFKLIKNQADFS
jgi:hypothetical protein